MAVARACAEVARTKSQIGHELDRAPGSLTAVSTLERRGVLRTAGRVEARGTRPGGQQWLLDPAWTSALQDAEVLAASRSLPEGADLVIVPSAETVAACEALASGDVSVAWGSPLRGEQMGLLLCPSAKADDAAALRLMAGLGRRGVRAIRLHLSETMASAELKAWAHTVSDTGRGAIAPPV